MCASTPYTLIGGGGFTSAPRSRTRSPCCGSPQLLDHAALATGGPDEEKTGRVQLMTLHKAKGLEFLHVFLPTWEAGVFQLLDRRDRLRRGLKALAASRQLGYAIPEKSLAEG